MELFEALLLTGILHGLLGLQLSLHIHPVVGGLQQARLPVKLQARVQTRAHGDHQEEPGQGVPHLLLLQGEEDDLSVHHAEAGTHAVDGGHWLVL